jgi:WD40 repeat protein/DNA-binding SARP family transcriptional activator
VSHLSITMLGSYEIVLDGMPPSRVNTSKARALLGYLAVEAHSAHSRESLAALLWPEADQTDATHSLRQALYTLRRALSDGSDTQAYLRVSRREVQFDITTDYSLDVNAFTSLLRVCAAHTHASQDSCPTCAAHIEQASRLYKGSFMSGFTLPSSIAFEEWRTGKQEALHRKAMEALAALATYYERVGEYESATRVLQRQLQLEPWREETYRANMRVLALSGQRDIALAQYTICAHALKVELGVAPSSETTLLREQILDGTLTPLPRGIPTAETSNPYRGLSAFRSADADDFCGRESFVLRLQEAVKRQTTIVVLGASGSGKSSLVQAGLLPNLASSWHVVQCRPGSRPFERLAEALLPYLSTLRLPGEGVDATEHAHEARKQTLAQMLREKKFSLAHLVQQIEEQQASSSTANAGKPPMLLVIDQFEELYTLCTSPEAQRTYLDLLFDPALEAIPASLAQGTVPLERANAGSRLVRLLCLRADFTGQALAYRPLADAIQSGRLILGPMNRDELRTAIEKPAQTRQIAFEPGLVERLLDDVGQKPGHLPLLQFTLTRLWEQKRENQLTHSAYTALGGIAGALTGYAEKVYTALSSAEQKTVQHVLTQMVYPGQGTEDTRRIVHRSELSENAWALVRKLADARLVVTGSNSDGVETAEIVHEAIIRTWGRLRAWLEADRGFHQWQERLRATMAQWQRSGRDEGALLRGALLSEAQQWAAQRWPSLSAAQQAYIQASRTRRQRRQAEIEAQRQRELDQAQALAHAAQLAQSLRLAANARLALRDQDTELALALALEAAKVDHAPPEVERVLAEAAYAPGTRRMLDEQGPYVRCVAAGVDGRTALSGGADQTLILWDLSTGQALHRMRGHEDTLFDVAYGPDGQTALSASGDSTLILWDLTTGQALRRFRGHKRRTSALAFHPDGQTALSASGDGTLILWDLATGQALHRYAGHWEGIECCAVDPSGRWALSGDSSGELLLWDMASGELAYRLTDHPQDASKRAHEQRVRGVAFLPDGQTAISVGQDRRVLVWDIQSGTLSRRFEFWETDGLYSIDLSPDGRQALIGTRDTPPILLHLASGQATQTTFGRRGRIECLVFHPDGKHVLTGASNGQVRLSDLYGGAEIRQIDHSASRGAVTGVDVSSDGQRMITSHWDHSLTLWDLAAPECPELRRWVGHESPISGGVRFLPDGRRALSGAGGDVYPHQDMSLRLWDLDTGDELGRFLGHKEPVWALDVSQDGRTAVSASPDGTIRVWELDPPQGAPSESGPRGRDTSFPVQRAGRIVYDFAPQAPRCLALSPDGRRVLAGLDKESSAEPNYDLWLLSLSDPAGPQIGGAGDTDPIVRRFAGHDEPVSAVAMSADGKWAISGALSGAVLLWDVSTGKMLHRLKGHTSGIQGAAFAPSGQFAVTSSRDGSLIVWNLETREAIRRYLGHRGQALDVCIAPDERTLFSAGADLTVREWRLDATQGALMDWIHANRFVPELTPAQRRQYQLDLLHVERAEPASERQPVRPGPALSQDDPSSTLPAQPPSQDAEAQRRAFVESGLQSRLERD